MSALRKISPLGPFAAAWEGEDGDEALVVTTVLGERVAARRTAKHHPWRIVAEWDQHEQLASIRCATSRDQIVAIVETLWRVRLVTQTGRARSASSPRRCQ